MVNNVLSIATGGTDSVAYYGAVYVFLLVSFYNIASQLKWSLFSPLNDIFLIVHTFPLSKSTTIAHDYVVAFI